MYKKILEISKKNSKIVHETPLLTSRTLNDLTGYKIFLKAENFQRMGAFKFRGAYNAISSLSEEDRNKGVITHSSGNHAQAIALAGKIFNIKTVIIMPENAPRVKVEATKDYGAEIVFCKPTLADREATTQEQIKKHNYTFIHPYDNDTVIQGQGTATVEIINKLGSIDGVIAPVGGGGLLSGTAIVAKESKKITYVFGAEPLGANDAYQSFQSKKLIPQTNPQTIADGLRTSLSNRTFNYISKYVDDIITVDENEIIGAMRFLFERMKIVVEPSGAVPVAAAIKLSQHKPSYLPAGSRIACIISGGNIDMTEFFKHF